MSDKIEENWKHINEIERRIKEQTGDPQAGFNANLCFFTSSGKRLLLNCLYRGKKGKKGQETFTLKYKELSVEAKFCPFSGLPLYTDSDSAETL